VLDETRLLTVAIIAGFRNKLLMTPMLHHGKKEI
jgi:hypothetical protein